MKKCLISLLLWIFFGSYLSYASDPVHYIFIGNPGSGKSCIINGLCGEEVAESGVSFGSGMTKILQKIDGPHGEVFIDTPGLSDSDMREQAAREIEKALKENGMYCIIFVVTLEGGRIKPDDILTINLVMDAIKSKTRQFNIILNKLKPNEMKRILDDPESMAKIFVAINSQGNKTESFYYIENDRDLEDEKINILNLNKNALLYEFIYNSSLRFEIKSQQVKKIKTDQYEEMKEQFDQQLKMLQEQLKQGHEQFNVVKQQMEQAQRKIKEQEEMIKNAPRGGGGGFMIVPMPCSIM